MKARVYSDASIEQYDKALENCEKGLKIDPQDTNLLSLKALIYLNMEKYDLAEIERLMTLGTTNFQSTI